MQVLVLDSSRKPLTPCHAAVARKLLRNGKAAVLRFRPFTVILKRSVLNEPRPLRLKIDPGSKVTGFAIVDDQAKRVVYAAELEHRGWKIKSDLDSRRVQRRARRQRNTRYRKSRFLNRRSALCKGLKSPSLLHRVYTVETWTKRFIKYAPIGAISLELVKFDTQKIHNPEITGKEYQQGELAGYELREYLLEKWRRKCAYCSAKNLPLQIEHIKAKTNGGTNRVNNLTLACESCNKRKGKLTIEVFLRKKPEILKSILAQAQIPLKDAAAVNSLRYELLEVLKSTGLELECGTGGRTKFNRTKNGFNKTHWGDAANVGASTPDRLFANKIKPLLIKAIGYGSRQMTNVDRFGFARGSAKKSSRVNGFSTGDFIKAIILTGKHSGRYFSTIVSIRTRGYFDVRSGNTKFTTSWKNLVKLQCVDGFSYY